MAQLRRGQERPPSRNPGSLRTDRGRARGGWDPRQGKPSHSVDWPWVRCGEQRHQQWALWDICGRERATSVGRRRPRDHLPGQVWVAGPLPVAHKATKVCACFRMICLFSSASGILERKCSMKSWGVMAARFHFSLFTRSSSICCGKRGRGIKRGGRLAPGASPASPAHWPSHLVFSLEVGERVENVGGFQTVGVIRDPRSKWKR